MGLGIITFSDLHLEFGTDFRAPHPDTADVMILAGDICTFGDLSPLERFLEGWNNPVLYVAGNHEYYHAGPMREAYASAKAWLAEALPFVRLMDNESTEIDGVRFFAGTMWTWFDNEDYAAMRAAEFMMNDYRLITAEDRRYLKPEDTVALHKDFMRKLREWMAEGGPERSVVITHHAAIGNPNSRFKGSPLTAAYVSGDAYAAAETYGPALWVSGHTHECHCINDESTMWLSNQRGYPRSKRDLCAGFDPQGALMII